MDKLLEKQIIKPTQKKKKQKNPSSISEIEILTASLPWTKILNPDGSTGTFYQTLQEELRQSLHTLVQRRVRKASHRTFWCHHNQMDTTEKEKDTRYPSRI